jgi:hypothetical protein
MPNELVAHAGQALACIEDTEVVEKIVTHLDAKGAAPKTTRRPPCRTPRQTGPFD